MGEYIVSARKYRPTRFDSVVGQSALTTTLKNAVSSGKLAHAYLFCGPRGVGKTTCARIFAKTINCLSPKANGEACDECESCKAFNEQRSLNIFELDAASNNSVDDIRSLTEQTRVPPQVGKYKVFIIDEVHMLSAGAFNAFLKTLEEPPAHVVFILATTEKHKVLPTIISRCQIYDFERMSVKDTVEHLKHVAQQEGISYEEQALAVIAEKADGGMRDALSIFDQAASFCQGNITYDKVVEDLNVLDAEVYFNMVDLCRQNKVSEVMVALNKILNSGFDASQMVNGLAKHIRNVMMAKDEATLPLLEVSQQQQERLKEQAAKCVTRFLYQSLRILNRCDINYRTSSNKRLLVELTLIEVAQVTQPDDNPVAGRRPRRLKSLFKNLLSQPRPMQRAPQVAPAEARQPATAPRAAVATASISVTPTASSTATATMAQLTSKDGQIIKGLRGTSGQPLGFSWNNVRQMSKQRKMQIIPGTLDKDDPNAKVQEEHCEFSQQELELQWMLMCNRMPEKLSGIATRMKNMNPRIGQFPAIEVDVDNQIMLEQLQTIQGSIINTLKIYLHNCDITLTMRVVERNEQVKILSRREQFEEMEQSNPAIAKLRELFDLELA